jgi:hypothetical protein
MFDATSTTPWRPSSAIPWKTDAAPLADTFKNPLYATISNADPPNRRLTGAKRSAARHSADNPLFDAHASGQRPRSSGSVIRFAGEHDGERSTAGIEAFRPGTRELRCSQCRLISDDDFVPHAMMVPLRHMSCTCSVPPCQSTTGCLQLQSAEQCVMKVSLTCGIATTLMCLTWPPGASIQHHLSASHTSGGLCNLMEAGCSYCVAQKLA